jgi:hypothetical protein
VLIIIAWITGKLLFHRPCSLGWESVLMDDSGGASSLGRDHLLFDLGIVRLDSPLEPRDCGDT